jgi:hypothetical protein
VRNLKLPSEPWTRFRRDSGSELVNFRGQGMV